MIGKVDIEELIYKTMASIKFTLSETKSWDQLSQLWSCLSIGKQKGELDDEAIKKILDSRLETKFWSAEEAREMGKKWFELPYQERLSHPEFFEKWELDSWLDAIESAEVLFKKIEKTGDEGELVFEQLAVPSGGTEALKFLVEIFDGKVLSIDVY